MSNLFSNLDKLDITSILTENEQVDLDSVKETSIEDNSKSSDQITIETVAKEFSDSMAIQGIDNINSISLDEAIKLTESIIDRLNIKGSYKLVNSVLSYIGLNESATDIEVDNLEVEEQDRKALAKVKQVIGNVREIDQNMFEDARRAVSDEVYDMRDTEEGYSLVRGHKGEQPIVVKSWKRSQDQVLEKLSEDEDQPTDITWATEEYNSEHGGIDWVDESDRDRSYTTLVTNTSEAEKFNYRSDYWGDASTYQQDNVDLITELEPYVGKLVQIGYGEDGIVGTLKGIAIDRQYNSISHTTVVLEDIKFGMSESVHVNVSGGNVDVSTDNTNLSVDGDSVDVHVEDGQDLAPSVEVTEPVLEPAGSDVSAEEIIDEPADDLTDSEEVENCFKGTKEEILKKHPELANDQNFASYAKDDYLAVDYNEDGSIKGFRLTDKNLEEADQNVIEKIHQYIIDDYHRMEDFTDTEVSESNLDSVHGIIDRVLSLMPQEELNKMANEIDNDSIDLTNYTHYCWELAECKNCGDDSCDGCGDSLDEEEISFDEIITRMSNAESFDDLRDAASLIVDPSIRVNVEEIIDSCEKDGDSVDVAYSVATSEYLDDKTNDLNEEGLQASNVPSKNDQGRRIELAKLESEGKVSYRVSYLNEADEELAGWDIEADSDEEAVSKLDAMGDIDTVADDIIGSEFSDSGVEGIKTMFYNGVNITLATDKDNFMITVDRADQDPVILKGTTSEEAISQLILWCLTNLDDNEKALDIVNDIEDTLEDDATDLEPASDLDKSIKESEQTTEVEIPFDLLDEISDFDEDTGKYTLKGEYAGLTFVPGENKDSNFDDTQVFSVSGDENLVSSFVQSLELNEDQIINIPDDMLNDISDFDEDTGKYTLKGEYASLGFEPKLDGEIGDFDDVQPFMVKGDDELVKKFIASLGLNEDYTEGSYSDIAVDLEIPFDLIEELEEKGQLKFDSETDEYQFVGEYSNMTIKSIDAQETNFDDTAFFKIDGPRESVEKFTTEFDLGTNIRKMFEH